MVLRILLPLAIALGAKSLGAQVPARAPTRTTVPAGSETRPTLVAMEGHGWFGFRYDVVRDSMFVTDVAAGSPAEEAGMKKGDWITMIDGKRANPTTLAENPPVPGAKSSVMVRRGSQTLTLSMVAVAAPAVKLLPSRRALTKADTIGAEARELRGRMALRATQAPAMKISPTDTAGGVDVTRSVTERRSTTPLKIADYDSLGRLKRLMTSAELYDKLNASEGRLIKDSALYREMVDMSGQVDRMLKTVAMRTNALAGAEFEQLNPGLAEYFGGVSDGVFVLRVADSTAAAKAGLLPGDVIEAVNGTPISTVNDLRKAMAETSGRAEIDLIRKGVRSRVIMEELGRTTRRPPD